LTLKVVFESRVTWATSVPILVFLGLSVLDLGPMYETDRERERDVRRTSSLNVPCPRGQDIIIKSLINSAALKKNSDALQAYVIQCCGTGVPSGVVQKLPSTMTRDAGRLVGCSKCLDRKQQSSCDRWFCLSVAHSVCRRQPTSDADVQQAQPPVGEAQPDRYRGRARPRRLLTPAYPCQS